MHPITSHADYAGARERSSWEENAGRGRKQEGKREMHATLLVGHRSSSGDEAWRVVAVVARERSE